MKPHPWIDHAECAAMVTAGHKIIHNWPDPLVRGVTDRNHHCAKFATPVSVLHQSPWKFCVYLYLGFVALLPKHHLCLHSALAHGNGPIFLKVSCTFSNVLQCVILQSGYYCQYFTTTALSFPLQKPHMKCMSPYSSFVNVLWILTTTTLQHNTATLA
jgi:hypothetical protein